MLADILGLCTAKVTPTPKNRSEQSVRQANHQCKRFLRAPAYDGGNHGWRGYRCWDCTKVAFTSQMLQIFKMDPETHELVEIEEAHA